MAVPPEKFIHEYWDSEFECYTSDDVTQWVREMKANLAELIEKNASLDKELTDIRTRRGWDELSVAVDERTGRMIVVRTFYQWEAKTLRLEVSPEMLGGRH